MIRTIAYCLVFLPIVARVGHSADVDAWCDENLPQLIQLYEHFHTHPELSFQERETGARVALELKQAGAEVTTSVGGHGVVAILHNGSGPTLMLRTDLDALPVTEQTNLVYASQVKVTADDGSTVGVMHACGHDVHMTNLVGVARYLNSVRDRWQGTLMMIGQPAEERGAGARAMLDDGLFDKFPKPDFAVALHVRAEMPAGVVGYRAGYAMANVDSVDITIKGKGGTALILTQQSIQSSQAAQLVMSLQTLVSREVKPIEPAVVTVGSIHGGSKHNVISNQCHLQLTVRSYSDDVRRQLIDGIRRKANAVAAGARAPQPEVLVSEGTPSLYNDDDLTARLVGVFQRVLGADHVVQGDPTMGGEDFSHYGRAGVPIMMYSLGVLEPKRLARLKQLGQQPPSLHSPLFYPEIKPTLRTGIVTMASAALKLLQNK